MVKKKDKPKIYGVLIIAFLAVGFFGIPQLGVPAFLTDLFGMSGFGGDDGGGGGDTGIEVYVKITVRKVLAQSTSDQIVNMYDEGGNFIDTVTTSSGIGTFTGLYNPGQYLWLQARQAAPASADPYVSPLSKWVVPSAGESADTVSLKNAATGESIMWVRDVTSTAPTLVVRNGWNNDTVSTTDTTHSFNTTDSGFHATLSLTVSNTYYGAEDFTDMETGKVYDGGVFLVLRTNNTHDFTDYDYLISDTSYNYYIWEIAPQGIYYDSDGDLTAKTVTAHVTLLSGSTFTADSSMVFDCHDFIKLTGGVPLSSADLIDGGAVAVTAVTTVVQ
jgi:hypothetical protein